MILKVKVGERFFEVEVDNLDTLARSAQLLMARFLKFGQKPKQHIQSVVACVRRPLHRKTPPRYQLLPRPLLLDLLEPLHNQGNMSGHPFPG